MYLPDNSLILAGLLNHSVSFACAVKVAMSSCVAVNPWELPVEAVFNKSYDLIWGVLLKTSKAVILI